MNDPRSLPNFDPVLYPRCNHDASRPQSAAAAEFLNAYYWLNYSYRELLSARAQAQPAEKERAALQAVERALLARDALEDKYASIGLVANPEFAGGLVVNVDFQEPPRPAAGSSLSMLFAVQPGPGAR